MMSYKKKTIFIFFILCMSITSNSQVIINHYLKSTSTVDSFDGLKLVAENRSRFEFLINQEVLEIKLTDTIPIEIFNDFVKNNLYPKFQQRKFPYLLHKNGKQITDSIKVTDVGLINKRYNFCTPRIVPILKREMSNKNIEFILYTDYNEGINIEMYLYDNSMGRVVSYIPLFSGEKLNKDTCELMGLNLVATCQTENVENGVVTQIVNDGFNDLWRRKIILNEDMYYEIIWDDNPLSSER